MTALDRRTLMAVTIAGIATPTTLGAKECPTMDWITISLQARNLAYNNVEHVGPENARMAARQQGEPRAARVHQHRGFAGLLAAPAWRRARAVRETDAQQIAQMKAICN